jgi:hypothetical protein
MGMEYRQWRLCVELRNAPCTGRGSERSVATGNGGTQGTLGYSLTSVMGAIPAESFGGRNFGSIFGMVMLAAILGGAAGPWLCRDFA